MMHETVRGCCPLCGKVMKRCSKYLICDFKRYNFPYYFYFCDRHGIFVCRGRKHELFDLSKRKRQAINIEPLEAEVAKRFTDSGSHMPTLSDYKPVMLKCPYCKHRWKQYDPEFLHLDRVYCPFCGVEILKEKAIVKSE